MPLCTKCKTTEVTYSTELDAHWCRHCHIVYPPEEYNRLVKEPPTEKEWREKTPNFITFDTEGEEVTGTVEAFDSITLHDKEITRCRLATPGGVISFLLTTQLEPLLADVGPGTEVKIRYEGVVKSGAGRNVKRFRVWVRE